MPLQRASVPDQTQRVLNFTLATIAVQASSGAQAAREAKEKHMDKHEALALAAVDVEVSGHIEMSTWAADPQRVDFFFGKTCGSRRTDRDHPRYAARPWTAKEGE
jgi:hypothetical protein